VSVSLEAKGKGGGKAYLQLLQPVFTLGALALLREREELDWEPEEDIGNEKMGRMAEEKRSSSIARWHSSPASEPVGALSGRGRGGGIWLWLDWRWRWRKRRLAEDNGSFVL
jgi:hypothetical protein